MVASITFRLKSSNHVGTIDMDGQVMTCREVQEAIAAKLSAVPEEVHVYMAGSTALLHPDEGIPAYAVVDVVRQTYTGKPIFPTRAKAGPVLSSAMLEAINKSAYGGEGGGDSSRVLTEEERLAQLQAEVSLDTGIDEVSGRIRRGRGGFGGRGRGGGGGGGSGELGDGTSSGYGRGDAIRANMEEHFRPPPKGYICHNCGKGGHLILHCPSAKGGKSMKVFSLPVGIPESMLVECTMDDPAPKFITRDHRLVKRRVDPSAFASVAIVTAGGADVLGNGLDEADGSADKIAGDNAGDDREDPEKERVDEALLCVVDHVVAKEAMKLPCCGKLLCSSCFTTMAEEAMAALDAGDDNGGGLVCPACEEPLLLDDVVPAKEEREKIAQLAASRKRPRAQ